MKKAYADIENPINIYLPFSHFLQVLILINNEFKWQIAYENFMLGELKLIIVYIKIAKLTFNGF